MTLVAREYPTVSVRTELCPECHEECGWCSAHRMNCREVGCMVNRGPGAGQKRTGCEKGEAEKGKQCGTCDGSGRVQVRREILTQ